MRIYAIPTYKYAVNDNQSRQKVNFRSNSNENGSFFRKVDDYLYRGRMPEGYIDLKELKDFGISTIVDLTNETRYNPETVKELGMKYINLPFFEEPNTGELNTFFNIASEVRANKEKMFVHCLFGRDRTGLMVNLYKIFNKMPINDDIEEWFAQKVFNNYLKNIDEYINKIEKVKHIKIVKPF